MRLIYSLPFWPYLYTPWLFREMQWMRGRGHHIAVISLGDPPGPAANVADFGLQDVPVLQVRTQYTNDKALLRNLAGTLPFRWRTRTGRSLRQAVKRLGLRQGLHEWATFKRVISFVSRQQGEVIEAHWAAHSAMMAREIYYITGLRYAVRLHGGDLHKNPSPNLPSIVADAAAVCPVSRFLCDLLLGRRPFEHLPQVPAVTIGPEKLHICHNGVPGDSIAKEPAPQRDDVQIVGTIGRCDGEKRHDDLIRAVATLKDKHPGLRVLIIGGGVEEPNLKRLAAELGIADRVEITGGLPWEKVIEQRARIHIYAHVSQMEGCSLAVAEGLAQGVPAVLTRVGAAVDSIEEGANGHTLDVGNIDALRDALDQLVSAGAEARHRMGAASLRIIRERFQFESNMQRLERLLENVSVNESMAMQPIAAAADLTVR